MLSWSEAEKNPDRSCLYLNRSRIGRRYIKIRVFADSEYNNIDVGVVDPIANFHLSHLTISPPNHNRDLMTWALDESLCNTLAETTDGFVYQARLFRLGPETEHGLRLHARYDRMRFSPGLFDRLAIPRPDTLAGASDTRLAEFLAGRILAQASQRALGLVPLPVLIGDDRAPVWPAGLAGSISHTHDRCVCLLLPSGDGHPGIDVESIGNAQSLESILQITSNASETALLMKGTDFAAAATLCFSAKETLFKALYPTVGRFFGFTCAELRDLPGPDRLRLNLTETLHPDLPAGAAFDIDCQSAADHVVTWLVYWPIV